MCVALHLAVQETAQAYLVETGRHFYVTPTSYLRLLKSFKSIEEEKRQDLQNSRETYANGVQKLDACGAYVEEMRVALQALQPELEQKTRQTEEIMRRVETENIEAEKYREIV